MGQWLKTLLGVLFAVSIVTANIVASKVAAFQIPLLGEVLVPAGFLAIAISFLWSDLLAELYSKETARYYVNATILAQVFAYVMIWLAIEMPTAPVYELSSEYNAVLGAGKTIVIASILTMFVSQNLDVSVFHRIKSRTGEKYKFVRNIGSTSVSQLVDTTMFILLAFTFLPLLFGTNAITSVGVLFSMIVGQYVVKLVIALADTPVFYAVSSLSEE